MDENALVDRVFMRVLSADTDEAFQACLHKFLPPLLLKLASPQEHVRKKVMELLIHVNKRLKSRSSVTLPVKQLLNQYRTTENSPMITNFSLVYIKMGFPRMFGEELSDAVPDIISLLPDKAASQQEMFMALFLPVMKHVKFPTDKSERRQLYGLVDHPGVRSHLLGYMLDILLMPYSVFPLPANVTLATASPPCYSVNSFKRVLALNPEYNNPDRVEALKASVTKYIISDVFDLKEITLHLIIASADSRYCIATDSENELKRLSSDINWEDADLIKRLTTIYLGTANQISRGRNAPPPAKESLITEAPIRIKAKIFAYLLKSKYAAQMFPQNLQIASDAVAGSETKLKLKKFGIEFIGKMADHAQPHHLKAIAPTLLSYLWKMVNEEGPAANSLRTLSYSAMGKLVHQVPSLISDNAEVISTLFSNLEKENDKTVIPCIRDALVAMTSAVSKTKQEVKEIIGRLLAGNMESECDALRRVTIYMAHHAFPTTWLPTRYLLLLACSDQLPDIQAEAKKSLHSKRHAELSAVGKHNSDTDLYPTFEAMSAFIEKKREERITEKRTITRGNVVMAFKPDTLQEMVRYLRTCLAKSCGVSSLHTTDISDWMEQAPIISHYSSARRQSGQRGGSDGDPPTKQLKSETEGVVQSLRQYADLLTQCISVSTNVDTVYLLLEVIATNRTLAVEFKSKIEWFKNLANNYDNKVQFYASQILALILVDCDLTPAKVLEEYIDAFKPSLSLEQKNGSLYVMSSLISYHNRLKGDGDGEDATWYTLTAKVVKLIERELHDIPKATVALQVLLEISVSGSLCLEYGSEEDADGEVTVISIVNLLSKHVKSAKLDSKQREKVATCLGSIGVGDASFPFRKLCIDGLCESSSTKELELHFTVGQALVMSAQGMSCPIRRDKWRQSESDHWSDDSVLEMSHEMSYLVDCVLDKYICHVNPHIKQAACVWLLTIVKKSAKFSAVTKRSPDIQSAFMRLLSENDEITQDVASKGLGLIYESCGEVQQKELISNLVGTLMTGKSSQKKSGEVSGESKLFSEGSLGSTPDGQGLNTYKELCAIATDLNQPDLIYKFLHLANHQSMWNSRKGAAFGFSTIAAQAGAQLAPYMSQIVPRLYRYTFDPNVKIQTAMRAIWNAVVKETKPTVDKYMSEILSDLLDNLTNSQWRVRESCCLAVNDLVKGRQLDSILDQLPELWHIMLKLLDDIKESTRNAATTASKTLSKVSIKVCSVDHGKNGEKALSLVLPVLLSEGITSNVTEVRTLSLDTVVQMSKNAGKFLKPHIHVLVPVMLESLSGLESQSLNYLSLRVAGREDIQQKLDKARVAASKMSPMMDSIHLCIQQVDGSVLPDIVPRLTDLIKNSIGLGTKVGIATVISALCSQCGLETMQPFTGKLMTALFNGLTDRNSTIRRSYATSLANVCKLAKDSSVEKLLGKLYDWYMEKQDSNLKETCGLVLKAMADICPDTLNNHKTRVLPLVFLAMHSPPPSTTVSTSTTVSHSTTTTTGDNVWREVWNEVTIGTDNAVRLYISEFISITDTALQSSSWDTKAQAAAAIATIAKSAGGNMEAAHLSQLVSSLVSGLSGRTWNGKEALLTAISDVCRTCSSALISSDTSVNTEDILNACLKEASKESVAYKIPAVKCMSEVLDSLKADKYSDLYRIVSPYLNMDKHEDEEVSQQLLIQLREAGFRALGKAWPTDTHQGTQGGWISSTTSLLLSRLEKVTWREQLAVWTSLLSILSRTELNAMSSSDWSIQSFSEQMIAAAIKSASESKYSAVREASCKCIKQLTGSLKGSSCIPEAVTKELRLYLVEKGSSDSSLEVNRLCEEIQLNIDV